VDTGEKRDRRARRVIPRAQRLALIDAYRARGMSMAAFARRAGIHYDPRPVDAASGFD
jgi:hypothetical protein